MSEPVIRSLAARRIWDSRGRPTIEAEIALSDGAVGRGIAPAGASRGARAAIDKRDGGKRFGGFDVQDALQGIGAAIAPSLAGLDPFDQAAIDATLIALDGTSNRRGSAATRIEETLGPGARFAGLDEMPMRRRVAQPASGGRT